MGKRRLVGSSTSLKKAGFTLIGILFVMTLISGILAYWLQQEILFLAQTKANLEYRQTLSELHIVKAQTLAFLKQHTKSYLQKAISANRFSNIQTGWKVNYSFSRPKNEAKLTLTKNTKNYVKGQLLLTLQEQMLYDIPFFYIPQKDQTQNDILVLKNPNTSKPVLYSTKYNNLDLWAT